MSDEQYVFPQDHPNGNGGNIREGGLTKRELFAAMVYTVTLDTTTPQGMHPADVIRLAAKGSVSAADILLAELKKPR